MRVVGLDNAAAHIVLWAIFSGAEHRPPCLRHGQSWILRSLSTFATAHQSARSAVLFVHRILREWFLVHWAATAACYRHGAASYDSTLEVRRITVPHVPTQSTEPRTAEPHPTHRLVTAPPSHRLTPSYSFRASSSTSTLRCPSPSPWASLFPVYVGCR